MTDANYTDITVVLDRSGSMVTIKTDTEGGFDTFIKDQAKLPGKCLVTLTYFDDVYEVMFTEQPVDQVPPLVLHPRGSTALLDAIGKTVTATGERLARMPEDHRPGKVILVIWTDGQENASQEWTRAKVFEAITHQREKYNWMVLFMGANQDAVAVGEKLGVARGHTMTFAANSAGVRSAMASTSATMDSYRSAPVGASAAAFEYSEEDREGADSTA